MGAFWSQVVNLVQPSERPVERFDADAPPPSRYAPNASLEAIGMQNETLRAQFEEVEHGFAHLDRVKGLFHGLLSPLSEVLTEFEATKARFSETRTKLALIEDAHESLASRQAATVEERDALAEARNALQRDSRELGQRIQRLSAALSEAQHDLRERTAAKERLDRLLDAETRLNAAQDSEIRRLKDELSSKDQALVREELSLKEASDQLALLSQENASAREASESAASSLETANRRIAELEARVDHDKLRLVALEQAFADEQATHANLRAKHLEHVERSRSEAATLNHTVHAVRGRVDVTNRLLDQARGQLREKIDELRAAERRLLENGIQIDGLEKTSRSQKDDLAAANERTIALERLRGTLVDQVDALTESLRARETALQTATRSIEQLTARVEEAIAARQRAKEELERRTAALQEEIVRVRAERQLADGALEASRIERQQARRGAGGETRAEAAPPALAEAEAAELTNVTKLPRAASL
jgi:chromosome segregation ATPase